MRSDQQGPGTVEQERANVEQSDIWQEVENTRASADAAAGEPNAPTDADMGNSNPERTKCTKNTEAIFVLIVDSAIAARKTSETDDHAIAMATLKNSQDLIKFSRFALACIIVLAMLAARTAI